ncbi:hypothetical protein [Streptomyces colonosanans]|uniref:Uncharacterized protein n=1 Tax=Streptomyces colonosanans TaxID=1428652 RepID=A0A1S2PDF3_9ACTN|nr:hypothetical protein [Streptomyces colonosanans]OIJ91626.1 hypothetical protein BIV24_15295 [Streptomyces colonosanans]
MAVIDRQTETALDSVRDRYGRTVDHHAAATARTRRNAAALETYAAYLAQHADQLLDAAHSSLDKLPAARHISAWRDLLAALGASHAEILRFLDRPATHGSPAEREQHAALWLHLAAWADYGSMAADLADQHHQPAPELTGAERRTWTQFAQAAEHRGELDLIESWFAADGRRITLADLIEDDTSTVIALAGDPDAPGWEVVGHYADVYEAGQALPRPVSPGVLRPEAASRFNRPEPAPERPLQELLQDVHEGQSAGDVSEALLGATQEGFDAGPMVRLQHLLDAAAEFSHALETVRGRQIGARLEGLGRQLAFLTREVQEAAEDLGATVAVLPPHRTPQPPRIRPRPALGTTPPAPPHRASAPARRP